MEKKKVTIPERVVEITFAEYVGTRIRKRRRQLGLTQDDVVGMCDISKPFLSEVETGKRSIGYEKLYGLARALERSMDWFSKGWDELP